MFDGDAASGSKSGKSIDLSSHVQSPNICLVVVHETLMSSPKLLNQTLFLQIKEDDPVKGWGALGASQNLDPTLVSLDVLVSSTGVCLKLGHT